MLCLCTWPSPPKKSAQSTDQHAFPISNTKSKLISSYRSVQSDAMIFLVANEKKKMLKPNDCWKRDISCMDDAYPNANSPSVDNNKLCDWHERHSETVMATVTQHMHINIPRCLRHRHRTFHLPHFHKTIFVLDSYLYAFVCLCVCAQCAGHILDYHWHDTNNKYSRWRVKRTEKLKNKNKTKYTMIIYVQQQYLTTS